MVSTGRFSRHRYEKYKNHLNSQIRGKVAANRPADTALPKRASTKLRTFRQLLGQFLSQMRGHRPTMVKALATLTIATFLNLIPPAGTKIVVDYVLSDNAIPAVLTDTLHLPGDKPKLLAAVAIGIIAISVMAICFSLWGRWQTTRITKRLQADIRRRIFEHAVRLPLHRVYQLKSGGVTSILRDDAGSVGDLVFGMIYNPWRAIIQLIGSLVILMLVDWRLLLGSLVLLPTVYITHKTWIARIRPLYRDMRNTRQHIDTYATEAFGGMRVLRSFGRQRSESARYTQLNHFLARQELYTWKWARTVDATWAILIPCATAALLWYGGTRVLAGAISIGDLVMFLAYLVMLLGPVATLAGSATQFQNGLAGLDRILDLLGEPQEMPVKPGAILVNPSQVKGSVSLQNVSFAYPGSQKNVLENINLDASPGELVALIGPSGSGKTTLCNLIARFYDPSDGVILLDDKDLRDIQVDSYRRLLGIVEQDIFLFDGTVSQNIGYARRGASNSEIKRVAELAHAHEFVTQLEDGYDTIIGERGVRLSGGQRQRLAIARAMLADPRILILDEATSSLDTENERFIQASLQTLMAGRTTFVIAHRLSTITHADSIVLLEDGKITAQGSHEKLLDDSPRYRQMVFMQVETQQTAN